MNPEADNLFDVSGHVACVTGASSGLGRYVATALALAGASVVGVARRENALKDWQEPLGNKAGYVCHDLMVRDEMPVLAEKVSAIFGAPDIIIHAAGINHRQHADEVTAQGWDDTIWLNLSVPFFLSQQFVPVMKARKWGRIVTFASLQTTRAFPSGIAYGASKGGIGQLTRAMAEAWSGDGINANAIGPGFFPTELTAPVFNDAERASRNANQTCIGRNGTLEDIRGPILFLCSDASSYVTGQVLMVDGGFTAK